MNLKNTFNGDFSELCCQNYNVFFQKHPTMVTGKIKTFLVENFDFSSEKLKKHKLTKFTQFISISNRFRSISISLNSPL